MPHSEQRANNAVRTVGRPFVKGRSGNPGGRPKLPVEIKARAQAYAVEMLDTLHDLAVDKSQTGSVRVGAAVAVLDRAYGKPTVAVAAAVGTLAELVEASMHHAARAENGTENLK